MTTKGIEAVFLATHNWGKAAKFFRQLGFELEFETDHSSGQFRGAGGPSVFVAEVPEDQDTGVQLVLAVPDESQFDPGSVIEVVSDFADTHHGTREATVRDPDGRCWSLQAPASADDA